MGLNSGEVVVRSIGSDLHMDYTAVGQTTHLAARMEQLASPGSIRITADTLGLAEGYVTVKSLGPVPVKGLSEPIEMYELVGTGVARTRLQAAAQRGLSRFVGRDAELEQLRAALEKAVHGHGQIVGVVGEPGVGKSRLFWEFTHSHRLHTWLILESSSASWRQGDRLPARDRSAPRLLPGASQDDTRTIRERVTGKLLTLDPARDGDTRGVESPRRAGERAGLARARPVAAPAETLDAVKRLLLRESHVQPCSSCSRISTGSTARARRRSTVSSRASRRAHPGPGQLPPRVRASLGAKTYYTQPGSIRSLRRPPAKLLRARGAEVGLRPVRQLLLERTEGNPFFLEECVRTLIETKVLVGERGAYRATRAVENIHVPATVQAILAARIQPGRLSSCS